ncbi:cupin domain-containing protein [Pseudomonas sp. SDO5511_1_S431]
MRLKSFGRGHWVVLNKALFFALISLVMTGFSMAAEKNDGVQQLKFEKILVTDRSWDGVPLTDYPRAQPELSVIKVEIPPHTSLDWHTHTIPSVGYLIKGSLTLINKVTGEQVIAREGGALAETLNSVHKGVSGDTGATLIVFYAGTKGTPLSVPAE